MIEEYRGVWVFIEQNDGEIEGVSLELLGAGRKLADKLEVTLSGVLLGHDVKALCPEIIAYGADEGAASQQGASTMQELSSGAEDQARTYDLQLRRLSLYPTELLGHNIM